jgi:hypothetical protein
MNYRKQSWGIRALYALWMLCMMGWSSTAFAIPVGPSVNVMPSGNTVQSSYTWVGNSLDVWGNVKWGTSTSGTYTWNFGDGTPVVSGSVTNTKYISVNHTYTAGGPVDATLTVTDGNGLSDTATVHMYVKTVVDKDARIELAIEKGLKWLYLRQNSSGQIYYVNSYGSWGAETASAVLAFENRGHKPCTKDLNGDGVVNAADRAIWEKGKIYAETVHMGLDAAIGSLVVRSIGAPYDNHPTNPTIPPTFGNGLMIADGGYEPTNAESRAPYKLGMYMTALVGAGENAPAFKPDGITPNPEGAPNLIATTGPAGVIGRTYRDLLGDMVDYADYSQYTDPNFGGWRYGPGYFPDNSACQWPAIGMEAAEFIWGVSIRSNIKTTNINWTNYSQYSDGRFGYTCSTCQGTGGFAALTGAGICQISFQGNDKSDPRITLAGNFLKNNPGERGTGNTYYMYSIAKGARIAKSGGAYSEIQLLGSAPGWDWYDEYSTWLINNQAADGSWYAWGYTQYVLDTSFAVEILTRNVFTLLPQAVMTASPNPTPALSPVKFDISGSNHQDPAKSLKTWEIDFDGDGVYDRSGTFPVSGPITYAGYPEKLPPANYTVNAKLRVSDNSTPQVFGETSIPVTISTTKVPPVANAGGPYNGVIGSPITFNGSASYSPNPGGTIVKYEWDLDGNGTYETNSGSSPTVQKTWTTPYTGLIGLKVTDNDGLTATSLANTQVFVVDLWPEHYVKVSERRISPVIYEYTYKFDMRNRGNAVANNVKMTLDSWPAVITVVDGVASFGSIAGGAVKTSTDTFSFRIDRRISVNDSQLKWKLEYDDAGGDHISFINFPLR